MDLNNYQKLAMVTQNKLLSEKDHLINGVMGLCGESGEVIDLVKKHLHHGHELDKDKIIDELGDVMWYLAEISSSLCVSLDDVANHNLEKLKARYPNGFSEFDSINRKI